MWFIIIMIVAFLTGIVCTIMLAHSENDLWAIPMVIAYAYAILSTIALSGNDTPKREYDRYMKVKDEFEMLQTNSPISFQIVSDFMDDIDSMNNLIDDSRKYKDNWYLGILYHEETAKFEKFDVTNINLNIALR